MAKVKIYSKTYCPYCDRAKKLLSDKGIEFTEEMITEPEAFAALRAKTGMMTVPQIFINDELVGGFTELAELDQKGGLDKLLS